LARQIKEAVRLHGALCDALPLIRARLPKTRGLGTTNRVSIEQCFYDEPPAVAECTLSRRELGVLRLIASGCSNKEVAAALDLRTKTVAHYASALYRNLGVHGRAEAVATAWRRGLLQQSA
jgi:DNA-binding NarL/FixJ family response regulator